MLKLVMLKSEEDHRANIMCYCHAILVVWVFLCVSCDLKVSEVSIKKEDAFNFIYVLK